MRLVEYGLITFHRPTRYRYSASEVTTLWRYTNLFIIIIIIIIDIKHSENVNRAKAGRFRSLRLAVTIKGFLSHLMLE